MIYTHDQASPVSMAAVLSRARSATNHGILYGIGCGGEDPCAILPSDSQGKCDCSGFALAWCQGISRTQGGKGKPWSNSIPYINTDAAVHDADGAGALFIALDKPIPGSVAVYPKQGPQEPYGHCCVITAVQCSLDGEPTQITGIDCHGGVRGHTVCAIEEHDLTYFLGKSGVRFVILRENCR